MRSVGLGCSSSRRCDELAIAGMDDTTRVERLDPAQIGISRFDPRQPGALAGPSYAALKTSIAETAGNLVPVLVRRLDDRVELVFGRRRLQACLELGLPVEVIVRSLSEHQSFETMVRVCAGAWSLYELGVALSRTLDAGLYPSIRRQAQACGLGLKDASLACSVAEWPEVVVQAFGSPTAITPAAARAVQTALTIDPDGVHRRAQALASKRPAPTVGKVVASLRG